MSLVLKNVVKRVGSETHIYDTSVELHDEGFNILLGTTLSGKTSLIQLMAGLERPTSGEIWFKGKNVTGVPVQKRNVSMVHQQFINYPNFSVFDNIASPLRVVNLSRSAIDERVGRVAEMLKLTPMLGRNPNELSGGQQQRTALARALVKDSDLVLLDEPLANLDYKLREELRDDLPKLFADRGCMVVYATSEPAEALSLGGHTAALHNGQLTQYGETPSVYRQPTSLRSAKVFSDPPINSAPVTKKDGRIHLNDQVSWDATPAQMHIADGQYNIAVRAHHITPTPPSGASVKVSGRILVTELSGSESVAHFVMDDQTWISQSHGVHANKVGAVAQYYIDIDRCLFFDLDNKRIAA
ncbi:MAG: ABC transporter ATP-binding protein [Rhodospirillaceae bacterium]|nr:ABC transporter ATP-binding protein [Rhodospirillaceae bacterium]